MATAGDRRGPGPERAWIAARPETGRARLDPAESRHLVRVRRVRAGEEVVLFDGRGGTWRGRLAVDDARAAEVEILGDGADREPSRRVVVIASPPEAGRADTMVEGLAELGVYRFAPLGAARTPPQRLEAARRRRERWERLAREVAKWNGRSRLLEIGAAVALAEAMAGAAGATGAGSVVLLDPDPAAPPLREVLPASEAPRTLLVGPEGGFTAEEVAAATGAGACTARVGVTALRTGTAALAAAVIALQD